MTAFALFCFLTVAFTWGGYPLLVAVLASFRERSLRAADGGRKRVSVILATRGEDAEISERLRDLELTSYPHELIDFVVALDARRSSPFARVDGGSVPLRVVSGDAPGGKAAGLNAAVRVATGEILVFADLAQRFDPDTIPRLVAVLSGDERLGAVSGALHLSRSPGRFSIANAYWQMERWLRRNEARLHSAVGVTGAVYAMRRSLWVPLPERLILDDLYTPMQLVLRGYRVGFDERALAHDARHFAPREEFRRKARTLTGVLQLCAWLPAVLVPARNPIWLQFVSHKLLRLTTPYFLVFGAFTLLWMLGAAEMSVIPGWGYAVLAAAAMLPLAVSRRAREGVVGLAYMQAAAVKAAVNALRGHWDVWQS